ncbi:MAG: aspartate-semialdehyde dehydrogenase [Candidatus Omnitrophica bacterium 4484_213]|nr:MAG: aspartate-semialdehyde dehydrogenase [Candidatus Omnitrophica bacterium 4484_213]
MKKYSVAVVGVGMVGIEMLRVLKERNFPLGELRIFARSARDIDVDGENYAVKTITPESFKDIDIALFAGTEGEKGAAVRFAPQAIKSGAIVIDNGGDFRLRSDVPLVVPEVNPGAIKRHKGLIANPNCTTIQMVLALNEIYKRFGLEQIILSSFQAVSGAGKKAVEELWEETKEAAARRTPHAARQKINTDISSEKRGAWSVKRGAPQLAFNAIPQIGSFGEQGYTTEEWKTVKETHKIFEDSSIRITSTCVRVPVFVSHSEAIYFKTKKNTCLKEIEEVLKRSEGVVFFKDPQDFPLPLGTQGKDEVFVGRLREDPFNKDCFWLWCVSDNLRKGAALNAVQIAELICSVRGETSDKDLDAQH